MIKRESQEPADELHRFQIPGSHSHQAEGLVTRQKAKLSITVTLSMTPMSIMHYKAS